MSKSLLVATTAVATLWSAAAFAEKWDMPMAYAASNYHSETGEEFAACVTEGTGGDIEIAVHPSGSLFSGDDIKRAVQTGQAPIGERLLSAHQNENALFGFDSIPFLATSFDQHAKLWEAAKPAMEELLASQGLTLLYSVPWPPQGLYFNKPVTSVADMKGVKFRSYNNATARLAELTGHAARPDRGGRDLPGVRHRRRRIDDLLRCHRLRPEGLGKPHQLLRGRRLDPAQLRVREHVGLGRRVGREQGRRARLRGEGRGSRHQEGDRLHRLHARRNSPRTA